MSTLSGLLDVRPDERRNTFAAFATLLCVTTGHTLLETGRDALFLAKMPASQLPWMYLVIVVCALGLAQLARLGAKADSKIGVAGALVFATLITSGFFAFTSDRGTPPWVLYGLYVWSGLFASWITVQFWTLLGRAYDARQAKRLYGFVGAGAVLGAVVGAFLARGALTMYGPRTMLLLAAALFLIGAFPVAMHVPPPEVEEDVRESEPSAEKARRSSMSAAVTVLWENAFAKRVLGIVLVSTITVTLADFLFKSQLAARYPDAHELGTWLSTFYAVTNTVALFAQLVLGPWIFRSIGVQRALFFFPLLMLGAAGGVVLTGGVLAAVILKGLDGSLRHSLHKTSTELLLVPVPDGTRERIKPIVDLIGSRGGQAIASIGILALVAINGAIGAGAGATAALGASTIGAIVLTFAVVWVALVVTIRRLYLDVFRETLKAGGLSGKAELPELDLGALETLFAGLNSSRDVEVLASLELLAEQHRERLIPALILYHPSRDVVLRSLELFTQRGRTDFVSIADRLDGHPDRAVAAAALRARTAVAPDRALLEERLGGTCDQVGAAALVALMARGWIDPDVAHEKVNAILRSGAADIACELARAIRDLGGAPDPRFDAILVRLARDANKFTDSACAVADGSIKPLEGTALRAATWGAVQAPDIAVRLEVARAMAVRKNPDFLPVLVRMLDRHELRATARLAIAEIDGAIDFLNEAMSDEKLPRNVRAQVPRTMSLFDPDLAARLLLLHLNTQRDGAVRFKVLRALVRLRRALPKLRLDDSVLLRAAETTLSHAAELRRWGAGLATADSDQPPSSLVSADPLRAAHHLLVDLVRDKEVHATQRLFFLLELLYGNDFEDIARGLRSKNRKTRASSLELVENLVRPPLRARVLALVGDAPVEQAPSVSYEEVVREILKRGAGTMRTLAEYRAVEIGIEPEAIGARTSNPPTIESIGKRLFDRARDLLNTETEGATSRAPA